MRPIAPHNNADRGNLSFRHFSKGEIRIEREHERGRQIEIAYDWCRIDFLPVNFSLCDTINDKCRKVKCSSGFGGTLAFSEKLIITELPIGSLFRASRSRDTDRTLRKIGPKIVRTEPENAWLIFCRSPLNGHFESQTKRAHMLSVSAKLWRWLRSR